MSIEIVGLSFLVILWWVGIWGCIETVIQACVKNPAQAFCLYFFIAAFALVIFATNPGVFSKLL
jgi:hypothetical protein